MKEVKAKSQAKYSLDEQHHFGLKPDLLLEVYGKKIIADTKYKMVYDDSVDKKNGISQNDLYQMVAYAIRFKATDIKLFYPNSVKNNTTYLKKIEILDELANKEKITITAHQLTVMDANLSVTNSSIKLSEHFEVLRINLIQELKEIVVNS